MRGEHPKKEVEHMTKSDLGGEYKVWAGFQGWFCPEDLLMLNTQNQTSTTTTTSIVPFLLLLLLLLGSLLFFPSEGCGTNLLISFFFF